LSMISRNKDRIFLMILSKILKSTADNIVIVDASGKVTLANRSATEWLNRSRKELIGQNLSDILPGSENTAQILSECRQVDMEHEINGKIYRIRVIPVCLSKKKSYGGIIICRDVSDYHNLQKLNRELDAVIEAISDSVYVTDGEGNTLRINSACQSITGLDKKVVIGMNMNEIVDKGMISHSCTLDVIKTRSKVTILQKVKDGKVVIVSGSPIFDEQGNIWRVVSSTRDITELNKLKSQIEVERRWKDQYYSELIEMKISQLKQGEGTFIATSVEMQKVIELSLRVARTDSTVLITGESGVGKEVITRFIHQNSSRRSQAFMKINCAAIPENLLESELFGYEPGAFTGAMKKGKIGLIELADKGTLFLDEIGDLPMSLQAKLLQVIQDRTFYRVGGTKYKNVDIRIIAATNRNLKNLVAEGQFREDLYYRLSVIPVRIPPLRERAADIMPLVSHFLELFNNKHKMNKKISNEAMDALVRYQWPGNIRELENLIEQMVVITPEDMIVPKHLPGYLRNDLRTVCGNKVTIKGIISFHEAVEEVEKQLFLSAYERYQNTYQAAKELGVSQPTVVRKLNKYRAKLDLDKERGVDDAG
jgi:PAS domain S-box-containing protein